MGTASPKTQTREPHVLARRRIKDEELDFTESIDLSGLRGAWEGPELPDEVQHIQDGDWSGVPGFSKPAPKATWKPINHPTVYFTPNGRQPTVSGAG